MALPKVLQARPGFVGIIALRLHVDESAGLVSLAGSGGCGYTACDIPRNRSSARENELR